MQDTRRRDIADAVVCIRARALVAAHAKIRPGFRCPANHVGHHESNVFRRGPSVSRPSDEVDNRVKITISLAISPTTASPPAVAIAYTHPRRLIPAQEEPSRAVCSSHSRK